MLTIARLRLKSWKCFRGEQSIELGPKAYAVFAREAGNPDRSNALGKSSLLEAVDFALYGRLADEFRARKRGWISRGEKSGEVDLTLSDGSRIVRSQTQAGSERLWCFPPGEPERGAVQGAAQQKIDELVGLSREDFAATRYFRQGRMAQLVTLDPGPRLELVAGWLRLGALEECEDVAQGTLRDLVRRRDEALAAAGAAEDEAGRALERAGVPDRQALGKAAEEAARAEHEASARLAAAEAASGRMAERAALRDVAAQYDRVVEQGKALAAEVGPDDGKAERERLGASVARAEVAFASAADALGEATRKQTVVRLVHSGEWDRRCPVMGGRKCPSSAEVADSLRGDREIADAQADAKAVAGDEYERARSGQATAVAHAADHDRKVARLRQLREEARRLRPQRDRWAALADADPAFDPNELAAAREAGRAASGRLMLLSEVRGTVESADARAAEKRAEAAGHERSIRIASAAAAIFGKAGAQRRMAEGSLAEIEDLANELLAGADVAFRVRVAWSREGSGVASSCPACGAAFPRSEKVKRCERCGEPRGANVVNRLEIEPSSQSGGARDLAGIFVQLAAAAWLAEDRGSRWGTAMLDEPLGALDAHHRRAISAHLPSILSKTGAGQAIVVAHHASVLDSLPGRIQVTSDGTWSRMEVVG